jgi:hypothetical protein
MICGNPTDSVFLMSVPANVARTGAKGDEAGVGFVDGSWRRKWLSGISDIILGHPAVAHTPGILQLDGPAPKCRANLEVPAWIPVVARLFRALSMSE